MRASGVRVPACVGFALWLAASAAACSWPVEPPAQPRAGDAAREAESDAAPEPADAGHGGDACFDDALVCDGACVDPRTDPAHCGACGAACSAEAPHTAGVCVEAHCEALCEAGWTDCNARDDDGCEVRLHTDAACTACVDRCGAGAHCVERAGGAGWGCCAPSVGGACPPGEYGATLAGGARVCCRDAAL